jgi:hypothetical protein
MISEEREALCRIVADTIREASQAGQLPGKDELSVNLRAHGLLGEDEAVFPEMDALLTETLEIHHDLAALESISGRTLYHAPALLSRTYAAILDRKASPVALIAEEVRKNSLDYPRPVPLDLFEESPFDLTPEQIEAALKTMGESAEFQDITYTTTNTGAVYLFSSRYLERGYAAFLAERADTGLLLNP